MIFCFPGCLLFLRILVCVPGRAGLSVLLLLLDAWVALPVSVSVSIFLACSKEAQTSGASLQSEGEHSACNQHCRQQAEVTEQREGGSLLTLPQQRLVKAVGAFDCRCARAGLSALYVPPHLLGT